MVSIGDPRHGFLHGGRLFDGAELDLNLPSLFVKPDEFFHEVLNFFQISEVKVPSFTNGFVFLLLLPPTGYFLRQSNHDKANTISLNGDPHPQIKCGLIVA
jgi:hypothetical protein